MAYVCSNPDCQMAETGKCVDGFEIGKCPHVTIAEDDALPQGGISAETISEGTEEVAPVVISSGKILTVHEATDVLCSSPTSVITVIGPSESGKTTFALCLYEAFLLQPFDRWSFAGSLTLPAFEERCHFARVACGNLVPATVRTPTNELGFLHLKIYNEIDGRHDLLISDRSGEYYRNVASSIEKCDAIHEVTRADYVLFFADGKKITDNTKRHKVKNDMLLTLRTFVENNVLGEKHRVGIVLTKYDFVYNSPNKVKAENFFEQLVSTLQTKFASKLFSINSYMIASRSEIRDIEPRFGVSRLLEDCIRKNYVPHVYEPVTQPDRMFIHLKHKDGGPV